LGDCLVLVSLAVDVVRPDFVGVWRVDEYGDRTATSLNESGRAEEPKPVVLSVVTVDVLAKDTAILESCR
jgi:hypothetical protein